jgi:hypothetical protein
VQVHPDRGVGQDGQDGQGGQWNMRYRPVSPTTTPVRSASLSSRGRQLADMLRVLGHPNTLATGCRARIRNMRGMIKIVGTPPSVFQQLDNLQQSRPQLRPKPCVVGEHTTHLIHVGRE